MGLCDGISRQLVSDEHETGCHDHDVCRVRMFGECGGAPPKAHDDEHDRQRRDLPELYPDIEGQQVWQQAVGRYVIVENLGSKPKPVEQTEYQGGQLRVRLKSKPALERPKIVQCLVDD